MSELNGRLNRLLIRPPADEVPAELPVQIRAMLDMEGIWIGGDSNHPDVTVPLASMGGKIFAMHKDQELDPTRFLPTITLTGPFTAQNPDPDPWTLATAAMPPPLSLVLVWFETGDVRVGQWNPQPKRWSPPKADRFFRVEPTHWRPLPAGPRT